MYACLLWTAHADSYLVHPTGSPYYHASSLATLCILVLQRSMLSPYFCSSHLPHSSLKSQQHGDDHHSLPPTKLCPRSHPVQDKEDRIYKCDRIWENPPYGIRARFAQCAFLVAKVEICQSPDFVIYVSNNPSSNCCRCLRRLVVLYKGEISLHFDPPSRHSCRTRSPLLWALIGIPASGLSRYS